VSVRVTAAEVREIIDLDATMTLTPFIAIANQLVTELCTGSSYMDARLKEIERWLSAHFCAIDDMRPADEAIGSVNMRYQFKVDLNLAVTVYGQQAMLIDTDGNLAALNKKITEGTAGSVSVDWLGTDLDD